MEQNTLDFVNSIESFDLILINGEGIIHGKKNADKKKVDEIFKFIKIIKSKYATPVVIFNSTISSLKNKHLKILRLVDRIYVKEKYFFNYLKKKNINSLILQDLLSLLIKGKKSNTKNIVTTVQLMNYKKTIKLFT